MKVSEAIASRYSTRAYLERAPEAEVVRRILERALRAPSGGNLQPWRIHALTGEPLKALLSDVAEIRVRGREGGAGISRLPREPLGALSHPQVRERRGRFTRASASRATTSRRGSQLFARNYALFGAPVGLFFTLDSRVGPPQWADMGMLMQNVMLLAVEEGLATCPQEAWSQFPQTLRRHLGLPETEMVFSGMALGFADEAHPINQWRSTRAMFDEVVVMKGFESK